MIKSKMQPHALKSEIIGLAALFFTLLMPALSAACPASVQSLRTNYLPPGYSSLCQLADRYEALKTKLFALQVDPMRIADIRAPRFINMIDWSPQAASKGFDPHPIYGANTWDAWSKTATQVDVEGIVNFRAGRLPAMTLDWLMQKNFYATGDKIADPSTKPGEIRRTPEYGAGFRRSVAPTSSEVSVMTAFQPPYRSFMAERFLGWFNSLCVEDLPPEVQKIYNSNMRFASADLLQSEGKPFQGPDGQWRRCGSIVYPAPEKVPGLLNEYIGWFAQIQPRVRAGSEDFILAAARAQRIFVAIHPFSIGNGRTSRLVLDLVTESYGLPAINLANQNNDLSTPEDQWATAISKGMATVIDILSYCAQQPDAPRCRQI